MKGLKAFLGFVVYTLTFIVVLGGLLAWWAEHEFDNDGPLKMPVFFNVERGEGLLEISRNLEHSGAVNHGIIFLAGARFMGVQGQLKAGEYQLAPAMSPRSILEKIRKGDTYIRRLTIREGLTNYEVANFLKNILDLSGDVGDLPPEGTLLPQTYDYKLKEPRAAVIARMKDDMTKTMDELWTGRAQNLPFATKEEAMTLASIVEKETGVAAERPRIAGVFINRLRQNMPLQSDPTVIFALTKGQPQNNGEGPLGRHLLSKDLEMESPYNTYVHNGLPPAPIANPGRAAIEAVLHPEENDYLYFVADGSGGHVFAKTLEEHNKNVAKWQIFRKDKEARDEAIENIRQQKILENAEKN